MRDYIKKQLMQVKYADLSNYDKETGVFIIKKYNKPVYDVGKCYIVQLPNHLVNNPSSLEAINYNNGTSPRGNILKIYVNKTLGKMIQVDSLVFDMESNQDTAIMWSGWLPTELLSQIAAI